MIAKTGASVEILNRERSISASVMGMNLTPFLETLQPLGVIFTPAQFLAAVQRDGNQLRCAVTSDYAHNLPDRQADQVVINHGTQPLDDLYWAKTIPYAHLGLVTLGYTKVHLRLQNKYI